MNTDGRGEDTTAKEEIMEINDDNECDTAGVDDTSSFGDLDVDREDPDEEANDGEVAALMSDGALAGTNKFEAEDLNNDAAESDVEAKAEVSVS